MIAYYFPPLVGIASERAASFARHLPRYGWSPVLIAPRDGFFHRAAGAPEPSPEGVRVVRTANPELSRALRRGYAAVAGSSGEPAGTVAAVSSSTTAGGLRRLVREALYIPDAQLGWIPFAARAAAREVRPAASRTVLFSTSVPFSAHLAAMGARARLARAGRPAPWVAEFRDPWSEAHPHLRPRWPWRRRLDRAIHRRIVLGADRVVVTSPGFRGLLLEAFPELDPGRVDVVMNGFEPGPQGSPPGPGEPLDIVYAGSVASGEDPQPIAQALARVHQRQPGRVRLRVLGPAATWQPWAGAPWLETRGIRSPEEARAAMRDASALFLLQSHPAYACAIPGKVLEYIGARRPVLAAVDAGWPLADLLRNHSDVRLSANTPEALDAAIEGLLAEHERGAIQSPRVDEQLVRPLQRAEQARRLSAVLDRALEA